MRFHFEIFEQDDAIVVYPYEQDEFTIPLTDFWVFIQQNELNQFCIDEHDASQFDGHKQTTGAHDFDSYFALHYNIIHKDLAEFIFKTDYKNYFNV